MGQTLLVVYLFAIGFLISSDMFKEVFTLTRVMVYCDVTLQRIEVGVKIMTFLLVIDS